MEEKTRSIIIGNGKVDQLINSLPGNTIYTWHEPREIKRIKDPRPCRTMSYTRLIKRGPHQNTLDVACDHYGVSILSEFWRPLWSQNYSNIEKLLLAIHVYYGLTHWTPFILSNVLRYGDCKGYCVYIGNIWWIYIYNVFSHLIDICAIFYTLCWVHMSKYADKSGIS